MSIKRKIKKVVKGVQKGASKALSAPSRARSKSKGRMADAKRQVIKDARDVRKSGAPDFDSKGTPSRGYKIKFMAESIKEEAKKKASKTKRGTYHYQSSK